MEIFYKEENANDFAERLKEFSKEIKYGAWNPAPEIIKTVDEDINEECWIVYFTPKPYIK